MDQAWRGAEGVRPDAVAELREANPDAMVWRVWKMVVRRTGAMRARGPVRPPLRKWYVDTE